VVSPFTVPHQIFDLTPGWCCSCLVRKNLGLAQEEPRSNNTKDSVTSFALSAWDVEVGRTIVFFLFFGFPGDLPDDVLSL
jgi:hypothetical protein